jgi:SAM-dependent methyltransferase
MRIPDIGRLPPVPAPWSEGEKIPWNEPAFSRRMLREHLSQEHAAASRRGPTIDRHVAWIETLLPRSPARILDLGCGPGLYALRLARSGHECVGIDFSPASIGYAREAAGREGLAVEYRCEDLRGADYGTGFDLAMLVYGEFNVFRPEEAASILANARDALRDDGVLLLEPQRFVAVETVGRSGSSWSYSDGGLFSDRPHLCLVQSFWHGDVRAETTRWIVIDAETGEAELHAATTKAYEDREIVSMLESCGFAEARIHPSLLGEEDPEQPSLMAVTARRA